MVWGMVRHQPDLFDCNSYTPYFRSKGARILDPGLSGFEVYDINLYPIWLPLQLYALNHSIRFPTSFKVRLSDGLSLTSFFFFLNIFPFIYFFWWRVSLFYLFLATLGLCCCTWAFSGCSERGLLFVAARGLLTAVASLVAEYGL